MKYLKNLFSMHTPIGRLEFILYMISIIVLPIILYICCTNLFGINPIFRLIFILFVIPVIMIALNRLWDITGERALAIKIYIGLCVLSFIFISIKGVTFLINTLFILSLVALPGKPQE